MNMVFLVTDGGMVLTGTYIYGVFSTRALAEAFIHQHQIDDLEIEEWPLDEVRDEVLQ